jgi:hypothetical protein
MNGYRDLERQLRESVRRRAAARAFSPRRWRSHRMALALAPLALVGGVATAATQLGHAGTEKDPNKLAFRAVKETSNEPACKRVGMRAAPIVDDAPPPAFVAALPELAALAPRAAPAHIVALARRQAGRAILGRTLRVVSVGGGLRLIVFVAYGDGPFALTNPQACLSARRARLAVLAPDPNDATRQAADRQLAQMRDTMPNAQTFNLIVMRGRRLGPSFGAGLALTRPLPEGIVVYGGGVYVGIAKPQATSIALRSAQRHGLRRRVAVHHGLFAFTLPRHTGPMVLTQRAANGQVLGKQRFRE